MSALPLRPFRKRAPDAREATAGRTVRELFELHGRMVHAVCRLNLRDRLDAEDATQQTFFAAYRSLLGGREPTDPPAWLATIARNECSRIRKQRPPTVPVLIDSSERAEGVDVPSAAEQREEIEALAAAFSELPPSQRDAVLLREFYGLSYKEVAAALGVSGPAVESLLFKGRKRLQEKLGSMRVASSVVLLPDTLRDALTQALPGFGGGTAAAAGAKVFAFPAAAKLAAVAVVVTGGGVTVAETVHRDTSRPAVTEVARAGDSAKPDAVAVSDSRRHATSKPSSRAKRASQPPVAAQRGKRHDTRPDQRESDMREDEGTVRQRHEDGAAEPEDDDTKDEDDDTKDEDEDSEDEDAARPEPVTAGPGPGDDATAGSADADADDSEGSDADDTLDD